GQEGRPVWLGAATFDTGVGVSHYTGAITHAIAPDIDATRKAMSDDLAAAGMVALTYEVSGVGPTLLGRNGEGDRYFTDGEILVSVLVADGQSGHNPPPHMPGPAVVVWKNSVWDRVRQSVGP